MKILLKYYFRSLIKVIKLAAFLTPPLYLHDYSSFFREVRFSGFDSKVI